MGSTPETRRVVYGTRAVEELCRARPKEVPVVYVAEGARNPELDQALAVAKDRGITVEVRPRALVADLAGESGHQGIVAIAGPFAYATLAEMLADAASRGEPPLLLLLDGITDPQNLGALVRSAEVMGAHGVVIPSEKAAPVTPGAVKASAGATERVRIARVANLLRVIDALRAEGVTVWAAGVGRGMPPRQAPLAKPTALVIGSEGRGLREAVARRCDDILQIPMHGQVASLNASAAGAILLYEALCQRTAEASSK